MTSTKDARPEAPLPLPTPLLEFPLLGEDEEIEVDPGLLTGGRPISFHIYAADEPEEELITGPYKTPVHYHLTHPRPSSYSLTLHRHTRAGALVVHIKKPSRHGDFTVVRPDGTATLLRKEEGGSRSFQGFEGGSFRWKQLPKSHFDLTFTCFDGKGEVVAVWKRSPWSEKKHGQLLINSKFAIEAELILATALADEEWRHILRHAEALRGSEGEA